MNKEQKIKEILTELNKQNVEIKDTTDLFATGILDSYGMISFIQSIEETFNIIFDNEDLIVQNFNTIDSILKNLSKYNANE